MVFPFALAVGVAMVLGILGLPMLGVLVSALACAALYMWNTRQGVGGVGPVRDGGWLGSPPAIYLGLVILMSLIGGAAYLLGDFFGWARLDG